MNKRPDGTKTTFSGNVSNQQCTQYELQFAFNILPCIYTVSKIVFYYAAGLHKR